MSLPGGYATGFRVRSTRSTLKSQTHPGGFIYPPKKSPAHWVPDFFIFTKSIFKASIYDNIYRQMQTRGLCLFE